MERERYDIMNSEYTEFAMLISSILLKVKGFFGGLISVAIAYLLSLFIPVSAFIGSLYLFIIVDLALGSWKAKHNGETFSIEKAMLTIRKFILYPVAVMVAGHFQELYTSDLPVTQVVAGTAAIFELRSIYGHISALLGIQFWDAIWELIKDRFPKTPEKK
jgi:hypothetical protein